MEMMIDATVAAGVSEEMGLSAADITTENKPISPQFAWEQVVARDRSARFLYGVTTTGIFCRPSCPSRRPAPRNVVFFRHAGAALAAGFRACLRCRPAGAPAEAEAVDRVCGHLKEHFDRKVTLAELGRVAGVSPFTVQRLVQRVLGVSASEFQRELRSAAFRRELSGAGARKTKVKITDAIYDAGYSSASRAYEDSRLGMSPARYRARGESESIRFATAVCPLGFVLVAATERGVCSISFGDACAALETQLRTQFPAAQIVADSGTDNGSSSATLAGTLDNVVSRMTEHPAALDLPLDVRATAFQRRVWQALGEIPRGQTRSYSEVARSLGHPRAVRAVARACASNNVALLVPCHRVVGSDGGLTGYRWGVERKRKLLDLERP